MRRHTVQDDDNAMDSLLDTLSNVIGILVIVLVVTQLGVGEAVQRIAQTANVDPAQLEQARQTLEALEQELDQQQEERKPVDRQQHLRRLKPLQNQTSQLDKALQELRKQREQDEQEAERARRRAEEARQQIEENREEREQLEKQLKQAVGEVARLQAVLDDTPPRTQLPAKVVHLPNPRPAPEDAKQILFICSEDRLYPLKLDQFRELAKRRAEFVVASKRLLKDPAEGIDPEAFCREFNRRPLRDEYFEVEMTAAGRRPRLVFHPRSNAGLVQRTIEAPRASFQRQLQQVDPNSFYCRFMVCTDSFDVYLTARKVVTEGGLLAGWEPQSEGWKYAANLGGPLRLGPPPKPDPNAKPRPPRKPAPPPNVID